MLACVFVHRIFILDIEDDFTILDDHTGTRNYIEHFLFSFTKSYSNIICGMVHKHFINFSSTVKV